jgi:hypothetical protein
MKATTKTLRLAVLGAGLIAGVIVLAMWLTGGSDRAAQANTPITVGFDMDPYSPETGAQCDNDIDDDGDTNVNDGCPIVGAAAEDPSCVNAIDDDAADDGATPTVNDGCPAKGAAETACDDAIDDDGDTRVNDGCPTVGSNPENPACANNIDDDPGDDGATPTVNDGCPAKGNSCPASGLDCTLGPIDACVEVPTGGGVITVDVFLDGLPELPAQPDEGGLTSFEYQINEKDAKIVGTVSAYTHDDTTVNLLVQEPAVNLQDFSDPAGSTVPGWWASVGDLGDIEFNPPFTKGVLSRLEINTTGTPDGLYGLDMGSLVVGDALGDDYCLPGSPVYTGCDIWDANASPDAYGLIAIGQSCPDVADLEKTLDTLDLDLDGDTTYETPYVAGLDIPVSQEVWLRVVDLVTNYGPAGPVQMLLTETCEPPESIVTPGTAGGECSTRVVAGDPIGLPTITVDGTPLNCMAPGDPPIECSSDCVDGVCPAGTVIKVEWPHILGQEGQTYDFEASDSESWSKQFDVHCYEPSTHVWHFTDDIEPADPLAIIDPDPSNNHLEFDLTLDCLAEADVQIKSQPFVAPPTEIYPGEDTDVTLRKTLHNIGPYGAVDVDITTDVTLPTPPPTCTADPDPANPTTANLPVSVDVVVDEVWTINCDADATGVTFTFNNSIDLTPTLHLSDPDLMNNSISTDLIVDVVSTLGDVDCSGDWDVVDAGYIFQYVLGLRTEGTQCPLPADTLYLQNADVNGDTVVNIVDAGFVFQCVLAIPNVFCPAP